MKQLTSLLVAALAVFAFTDTSFAQGGTQRPQAPNAKFDGTNNEFPNGTALKLNGDLRIGFGTTTVTTGVPFTITAPIPTATAGTPVVLIPASAVGPGRKVYVTSFVSKVDGNGIWAGGITSVKLQDTNATPVDFVTVAVAAFTANAIILPSTANVTLEPALTLGAGGTAAQGLQVKANANGSGSPWVVTVTGVIK